MSICQLQNAWKKCLLLGILGFAIESCSTPAPVEIKNDDKIIKADWLKLPLRFAHRDKDDNVLTHPFFDVDPSLSRTNESFSLRYFVTTPAESGFQYDLDLYSGRLFREREFCQQEDIWEFYSGKVERPNFTQGIVPRIFDQNNQPQRLIVLSGKEHVPAFMHHPTHFDEARIMGSLIVETCESFPCDRSDKWYPTQILVGTSPTDSGLNGASTFSELKKKVDWDYLKAMLTNMHGSFLVGGKNYPAYRISRELNTKDTKAYFDQHSTIVNMKKLEEWRVGCMKMYDGLWESTEKIRARKHGQTDEFLKLFKGFYTKDSEQFYGCLKLVRPANINEDYRRLWFFSFMQAFALLEKNGFYYNCHDNAWAYNPKVDGAKYFNNQNSELARCRAKDFEKSFEQAINGMASLRNQTNRQFRFVEFDNVRGGSHQMIYGWLPSKTLHHACAGSASRPSAANPETFPHDVIWESFKPDDDRTVH